MVWPWLFSYGAVYRPFKREPCVQVQFAEGSQGSVVLQAAVSTPTGVSAPAVQTSLKALQSDPEAVVKNLYAVPGAAAIVEKVSVTDVSTPTIQTPKEEDEPVLFALRMKNIDLAKLREMMHCISKNQQISWKIYLAS